MTNVERALALLLHAHAPATTLAGSAIDDPRLSLRNDLGFDLIALAEFAVGIEDAFDLDIDLDECRKVGDLQRLVAGRSA